ncbi:hypothetical protein [Microbacterium murale]|uniref:GIY-YIG nuclease family protein n=1 Tax=Microbacterium murale TaxID=1081040 RepID=A0ABQ1RRP8_9MICO|nr:hypothetical protein [Microbacterium murale]GGD76818.1 hypothetical protein GCM10007269_19680 [Microbacterium murale]
MQLEITSTPRDTHVWAPTAQDADHLRRELTESGFLVLDANPWGLNQESLFPEGEHLEFDPERIFDVTIGADANATLQAIVDSGHTLIWHRWQTRLSRKVWGVNVAIPARGRRRPADIERAEHFGLKVRGSRDLGLRMSRDTYARINKRSSAPRRHSDDDPELSDAFDSVPDESVPDDPVSDDPERKILFDEWCAAHQKRALTNFDLNMAHFASLDHGEFEQALQHAISGRRKFTEVTDLTLWDGVPGLYIMVLDEYRQAYVGATDHPGGIMARIRQHWAGTKSFDRLIWGGVESSILSIDSFRALDTTRIFAVKTSSSFDGENTLLDRFPPKFMLNRIIGGRDAVNLAGLLGVDKVMKLRDFAAPPTDVFD